MNFSTICRTTLFATTFAAATVAMATDADIKKSVETLFPKAKVEEVRKMPMSGLYEVRIGRDVIYTDEKGSFVIVGDVFDAKARKNLTEERKLKLAQIKFSDLPLELAVKTVRGNGKRVFATFEDPNCGYCKKLAQEMAGMTDITMYTFLYPILSPDSTDKAKAIWCSSDRAKAWNEWMVSAVAPKGGACDNPTDKVVALGQKLGVNGTPTIFFADGSRAPGYLPAPRMEDALNQGSAPH